MTADRWERRTGHIESDGFTLQYIVEGRGPTALVVGSALYYSRTFSQNLRSHLRLAFVDHRGFAPGNTCTDRERYRLELLLEDMELARERLKVIRETNDGFEIARRDLELRGPGELLGTRQTGLAQLRVADLMRDADLLPRVHEAAELMLERYPDSIAPLAARWIGSGERYGRVG